MSRRGRFAIGVLLLLCSLAVGLIVLILHYERLPERLSQHETIVLGQTRLVPGSTGAMRVVVRDSRDASPLSGAGVKVVLRPAERGHVERVFAGTTDASGTLDVSFAVPEEAAEEQVLVVETTSSLGSDRLEKPVTIARDYRLLVTTDKPLYQPGQIIHIRVLALGSFDRRPAATRDLEITVADGKGNTVFRKPLTTSEFGIASVDFQLADEVNTGLYKIAASLDEVASEKTVTVEHYVLPKFKVQLTTGRAFYQPGDTVEGTLTARYFFGKDVADSTVVLEGYTYEAVQNTVVSIEGKTDSAGVFEFAFQLPDYLVGTEFEDGRGRFYLEARVTDQAAHTEVGRLSLPVSESGLVIDAVPEAGQFRTGVENILYILTSYPDGSPAEAELEVLLPESNEALVAKSGRYGLAEVRIIPHASYVPLTIVARDETGLTATREFVFGSEGGEESVLLRPDGALYRVGETLELTILTSQPRGTVYLDVIREGQTASTRAVDVEGGRAEVAVDLTPDLYGTLELHAYKLLRSGSIVRDTRLVVVDEANDLGVTLRPGADTYKPGDAASLGVEVRGITGDGVQAALGLAVVDESVFALAEQDPGFAKLYFMLEQELLTPKYELHGFSIPRMIEDPCRDSETCPEPAREASHSAGKAALASAASFGDPFTLTANSHDQAVQRARELQKTFYRTVATGAVAALGLVPLIVMVLSVIAVARAHQFWKSLAVGIGLLVVTGLSLAGFVWLVDEVLWRVQELVVISVTGLLGLAALVSFIVLIVVAIRSRDASLGVMLGLIPVMVGAGAVLTFALSRGNARPQWAFVVGLVSILMLPLAFLVRGAGLLWERRALAGLAAATLGFMFMVALLPLVGVIVTSGSATAGLAGIEPPMEVGLEAAPGMMGRAMDGAVFDLQKEEATESEVVMEEAQVQIAEPRLRQYFPETMLWLPDEVTDDEGRLDLTFNVADSITTWRITALASSQDGRLGSATGALRVFQDFFIDLDLPLALTVGDEISIPVGVFNYLPEAQTVRLDVETAPWFELLDDSVKELEIAPNDISVVFFRIRAVQFGQQPFQVTAYGSQMSDAIRKEVRVFPAGKELRFAVSDRLMPTEIVVEGVEIPKDAIPGTQKVVVKIYPGVVSQVVEGLDALLRMPFGCFEQTSSTTYPNVLVLDYLKTMDQVSPEVQMKAEQYINLGYQRLTTFEVDGDPGGFSLFGEAPADPMLTAYGLQEFGDMSRVYEVDPALIGRVADWLFTHQAGDGSWRGVEGFHETSLTSQTDPIPVTAFVVWGLADAGYADDARTQRGVSYLRERASAAETTYDLALVANALVAVDVKTGGITDATASVLTRLADLAQREGESAYFDPGRETYMGGYGLSGRLETTASAALAFLRAGRESELADAALTYLVRNKDSFGTWETTSATVLALKALIESVRAGSEDVDAAVALTLDGGQTKTVRVTPETFDVVQMVVFDDVPVGRAAEVGIEMTGNGRLMYQVMGSYYLPWEMLSRYGHLLAQEELVTIDVAYDRTELTVDDTIRVDVTVTLKEADAVAEQSIVDLGLPPGFTVETEDLTRLVARFDELPPDFAGAKIERFELTGRQIILYVSNLSGGEPLTFAYRLRAKFPLIAQTPASTAYDYYNPSLAADAAPETLVVVEQ
ncbi:MAG: MG2 domain-containing protein [Anaerolineae bacterium]